MFSAAKILSIVLHSDCNDFGSVQRFVANVLYTLEDVINDANSIYFQSPRKLCAKYTQKYGIR